MDSNAPAQQQTPLLGAHTVYAAGDLQQRVSRQALPPLRREDGDDRQLVVQRVVCIKPGLLLPRMDCSDAADCHVLHRVAERCRQGLDDSREALSQRGGHRSVSECSVLPTVMLP